MSQNGGRPLRTSVLGAKARPAGQQLLVVFRSPMKLIDLQRRRGARPCAELIALIAGLRISCNYGAENPAVSVINGHLTLYVQASRWLIALLSAEGFHFLCWAASNKPPLSSITTAPNLSITTSIIPGGTPERPFVLFCPREQPHLALPPPPPNPELTFLLAKKSLNQFARGAEEGQRERECTSPEVFYCASLNPAAGPGRPRPLSARTNQSCEPPPAAGTGRKTLATANQGDSRRRMRFITPAEKSASWFGSCSGPDRRD